MWVWAASALRRFAASCHKTADTRPARADNVPAHAAASQPNTTAMATERLPITNVHLSNFIS
jgi:hypothetical protein